MQNRKTYQAKQISDSLMKMEIELLRFGPGGVSLFKLQESLYPIPPKVVQAKLRSMVQRGLIDGCACGCHGGFKVV